MKDFWNKRYSHDEYAYGKKENDFLSKNVKHLGPNAKILCLAEGEGRNAVFLASKGFDVTAVDISTAGREKALKLAVQNETTIKYDIADLRDYDFGSNNWDAIISIFAHTPPTLRTLIHSKVKKALKKNGYFLLEGYNEKQLQYDSGGPKDKDMLFSKKELQEDFGSFSILLCENTMRSVNEGRFHNGKSSVTQLIAKK